MIFATDACDPLADVVEIKTGKRFKNIRHVGFDSMFYMLKLDLVLVQSESLTASCMPNILNVFSGYYKP